MHYKLDLGIDHVLIDEAQDTSPKQWEVIERLVAEFAAGAGARGTLKRSIFAVGDDKQSIFSFQGAEPEAFAREAQRLPAQLRRQRAVASGRSNSSIRSARCRSCSMRSTRCSSSRQRSAVLPPIRCRLRTPRCARRRRAWWKSGRPDRARWAAADRRLGCAVRHHARRRARGSSSRAGSRSTVALWIARGDRVGDGENRHPVRPGDVLLLVRQRGPLFEAHHPRARRMPASRSPAPTG